MYVCVCLYDIYILLPEIVLCYSENYKAIISFYCGSCTGDAFHKHRFCSAAQKACQGFALGAAAAATWDFS